MDSAKMVRASAFATIMCCDERAPGESRCRALYLHKINDFRFRSTAIRAGSVRFFPLPGTAHMSAQEADLLRL
jgi:hypothetical protein